METKARKRSRLTSSFTLAIAAWCLVGVGSGCSANRSAHAGMTDAEITSQVEETFAADGRFDAYTIVVTTEDRRVHLSGTVTTADERNAAEKIAAASPGVDSVDNYIRFDPSFATREAPQP